MTKLKTLRKCSGLLVALAISISILFEGRSLAAQQCYLPVDIYQRRIALEQRYAREVGNNYVANQKIADDIHRQINELDRENYVPIVADLCSTALNGDLNAVLRCCSSLPSKDPVVGPICGLSIYLASHGERSQDFLSRVPTTEPAADGLWLLQEIDTTACTPSGPTFAFLKELFSLVESGNRAALDAWLNLSNWADGVYGEEVDGQMIELIIGRPVAVLENWRAIRDSSLFEHAKEYAEGDERQRAIASMRSVCSTNPSGCAQFIAVWSK